MTFFFRRHASYFSVALATIVVNFHWEGLSEFAKFLPYQSAVLSNMMWWRTNSRSLTVANIHLTKFNPTADSQVTEMSFIVTIPARLHATTSRDIRKLPTRLRFVSNYRQYIFSGATKPPVQQGFFSMWSVSRSVKMNILHVIIGNKRYFTLFCSEFHHIEIHIRMENFVVMGQLLKVKISWSLLTEKGISF